MSSSGESIFSQAESCQNKIFRTNSNTINAAELFIRSAQLFKINRNFARAGEAYERAYLCFKEGINDEMAFSNIKKSIDMYCRQESTIDKAISLFIIAIEIAKGKEELFQAADLLMQYSTLLSEKGHKKESEDCKKEASTLYSKCGAMGNSAQSN